MGKHRAHLDPVLTQINKKRAPNERTTPTTLRKGANAAGILTKLDAKEAKQSQRL